MMLPEVLTIAEAPGLVRGLPKLNASLRQNLVLYGYVRFSGGKW